MQKLILPINKSKLTASWKTTAYTAKFGFIHYGIDLISTAGERTLYASGGGVALAAGTDSAVGNVVVVLYPGAYNRVTKKTQDVVFRYFHLGSIKVSRGQRVTKDTELGRYGTTGLVGTGAHLHLEADTDTTYFLYSPTVWSSNFLRGRIYGANDKTMTNPLEWLHRKSSAPDNQMHTTANDQYIRAEDKTITVIK